MNKFRKVLRKFRALLPWLLVFAMGVGLLPAISGGQKVVAHFQFMNEMANNPAYRVVEEIESAYPEITVLAVEDKGKTVNIWVIPNGTFSGEMTQEEYLVWLISFVRDTIVSLASHYPEANSYQLIRGSINWVPTIEGPKMVIQGAEVFAFSYLAVDTLREMDTPCLCVIDALSEAKIFKYISPMEMSYFYRVYLAGLIQREPGYLWPWD